MVKDQRLTKVTGTFGGSVNDERQTEVSNLVNCAQLHICGLFVFRINDNFVNTFANWLDPDLTNTYGMYNKKLVY